MVRLPPRLRPLFPYLKSGYVCATRALAPATVRIARTRGGYLPSAATTLPRAAATTGGTYALTRPPERVSRAPMLGVPAGLPLADRSDGEQFAAVGVAELPGGRVLGPHRAVISARGDLVHDVCWYFGTARPREHPLYLNPFPPAPLRIPGRLGVLAARGDANYYHFLMDVIAKLGVLEQTPALAPPERWYVPRQTRFQRELLDLAAVPADAVVDATVHPHVTADVLVVPAPPEMTEKNPPWAVRWLRDLLLPRVAIPQGLPRRIYVTRGASAHNRSVVNEDAVRDLLAGHGFVAVDPAAMPVAEQIAVFATAELIVAPHGAALANLIFARPGAAVVELFPAGCLLPDFWRLACGVDGLAYRYLSAPGRPPRRGRGGTIVRDIEVDLGVLERLVAELS